MQTIPNITDFLFHGPGILILKIPLLILIALYAVFLFIIINRIKALNRTVMVTAGKASQLLQTAVAVQLLLAVSLFLLALVIV